MSSASRTRAGQDKLSRHRRRHLHRPKAPNCTSPDFAGEPTAHTETIDTAAGPAQLRRSARKTLAISVCPDGSLELVAPASANLPDILARVAKRLHWIHRQRREFAAMNASHPAPRYVNGATHRYLGKQYRLKITNGTPSHVALRGAYFHITLPVPTESAVRAALDRWLRERARDQFEKRISAWHEWCTHRRLPIPRVRLRSMPKRWGSTSRDGIISLNPELIHAPSICVDYVIAHEICHLRHPNHGPAFYRLLATICPLWRTVKRRLEQTDF